MKANHTVFVNALALLVLAVPSARANDAISKIREAGVTLQQLEHCLQDADASYSFRATTISVSKGPDGTDYSSKQVCEFDPTREVGERWKLLSFDDKPPTEQQVRTFKKTTNTTKEAINGKIDPASVRVIREDGEKLIVGLRYEKKSLPKKYRFLYDCDATFTISKQSRKVESATYKNYRKTKLGLLKVPDLTMEMDFVFLDEADGYHIRKEDIQMTVRLLGAEVQSNTTIEYTDFKKVK